MQKFITKLFLIFIGISLTLLLKNYKDIKNLNFSAFPKNNLSNSVCFRAKIDHLVKSANFKNCTFLIAGSSMSLCNISGQTILNKTKECVYNFSAWGTKPNQIVELLNIIEKRKIKYLLVAFNNVDFGDDAYNIDFKSTNLFINSCSLVRYWLLIKEFNYPTFSDDVAYRNKHSNINNEYESLNFDNTGTIQFEQKKFIIDSTRWKQYKDTIGFSIFHKGITRLHTLCKSRNIELIIVYLPFREDLLNENYKMQNRIISKILKSDFNNNFIDLHNMDIPSSKFCDGTHFFKDGAIYVTNIVLDSINIKKDKI
jgi:hypothetical protein